jgi:hypothetical protein
MDTVAILSSVKYMSLLEQARVHRKFKSDLETHKVPPPEPCNKPTSVIQRRTDVVVPAVPRSHPSDAASTMSRPLSPGPAPSHPQFQQPATPQTVRQKAKVYAPGIVAGVEDVKYQAKYKDLKRKVKEIEAVRRLARRLANYAKAHRVGQ